MENEAVAVGGEDEGDVQRFGVVQCLLHAVADAVVVVLGLDQPQRDVRLVVENAVGPLGLAAGDQFAADDNAALGEIDLFADLRHGIPAGVDHGGGDEFGADVAFTERFFVDRGHDGGPVSGWGRLATRQGTQEDNLPPGEVFFN